LHFGWIGETGPNRELAHPRGADVSGHRVDGTTVRKNTNEITGLGTTGRHGQGLFSI